MCGIIMFSSPIHMTEYKDLFDTAYLNKHRGHKDGWGIIDIDSGKVLKQLVDVENVVDDKLDISYGQKKETIGILTYKRFNEEYYKERQAMFLKRMTDLKKKESGFVILHHRSASMGVVNMNNTHPLEVSGRHYIHNGTVWGTEILKSWWESQTGLKFTSDTDTEVIAQGIEFLSKKHKGDGDKVYEELVKIFPDFGVIMRVNPDKTVEIWKTDNRHLFFYVDGNDVLAVSEPVWTLGDYAHLYSFDEGYLKFTGDTSVFEERLDLFVDYTERMKVAVSDWAYMEKQTGNKIIKKKCDDCKTEKLAILTTYTNENTCNRYCDLCFECWLLNVPGIRVKANVS